MRFHLRHAGQRQSTTRALCLASLLAVGVSGCGGGSGGGDAPSKVVVSVTDVLGAPVDGANVTLNSNVGKGLVSSSGTTDAAGTIEFDIVAHAWRISADASEDRLASSGRSADATPTSGQTLTLPVTIRPTGEIGLGYASTTPSSIAVSSDGHQLQFTLRLLVRSSGTMVENAVAMVPCEPATNTAMATACIEGPNGFTATYDIDGEPIAQSDSPPDDPHPFSVALLVDQSRNTVANDPWDVRLFDLKYFLVGKRSVDRVLLAAFAADDDVRGESSPLPQQPISIFPIENPVFSASLAELYPIVDSLAELEGGAAPLYPALDNLLDVVAARTTAVDRPVIVVLTDSQDDSCASASGCRQAVEALTAKSRELAIPIVTVGLAGSGDWPGGRRLAQLAEQSGGFALWATDWRNLGPLMGELPHVLSGDVSTQSVLFRIQSSTPGAFQSGNTVFGELDFQICPYGCYLSARIPFAVAIP